MLTTRQVAVSLILLVSATSIFAQTTTTKKKSPDALVAELYQARKLKRGYPFFQTRSRVLVDKYFVKALGDLIWKDAKTSKGEVGVIDGDPLYDAQDFDIKHFAIGKPTYENSKAKVAATFENMGEKKTVTFVLVDGPAGWRIDDIDYGGGRTLRSYFKDSK